MREMDQAARLAAYSMIPLVRPNLNKRSRCARRLWRERAF